jgi:hypothetical protein
VRFVASAGGSIRAAREALVALFRARGWRARIAVVEGDALLERIDALRRGGRGARAHGLEAPIEPIRDRLLANRLPRRAADRRALAGGADIVITGRGRRRALPRPMLRDMFGWGDDDWNQLAQGVTVGHLLECSGQGAGGNFGSAGVWQRIPDLAHIGYPIAEVGEDASVVITKAPGTGGRINFHTLRQQLLYEVHDPRRYVTPDVVLDMGTLRLEDLGGDHLRVSGATGRPAPERLKVVAGYADGWMGHCVTGFCWPDALAKARAVAATVRNLLAERRMAHDALAVEYLGHDTVLGPHADRRGEDEMNEVWLRMAIRTQDKRVAEAFPRLFPWLALSGPPYMGGFHGMPAASQLIGLWPSLVRREAVETAVTVDVQDIG